MNKEVNRMHAIMFVVIAITLALIISIFPLRLWNVIQTETGGGQENGCTQGVDSTHDAVQDFIAQYDRIDSVSVYVSELCKGRYMHISFWDVDNWKVMYEETIDLGQEEIPGYVDIPLGLDLSVGGNYRIMFTVWCATYTLGTESVEGSTNPAIGTFYYQDTTVEGSHLLARYNYSVPVSKVMSISLIGMVIMIGCALCGVVMALCKNTRDKSITIGKMCRYIFNPIAVIIYSILAIMVYPLEMFDDRASDIIFYEIGLLIAFIVAIYAINHKRDGSVLESIKESAKLTSDIENIKENAKMVSAIENIKESAKLTSDIENTKENAKMVSAIECKKKSAKMASPGLEQSKIQSLADMHLFEKFISLLQMVLIALSFVYSAQYMNDLADIYHSISERELVFCLLLVIVCFQKRDELISIQNALIAILGAVGGFIFYHRESLPVTEKEYDLHNLILGLNIAIVVVCICLFADFIRFIVKSFSKRDSRRLYSLSTYGILVIAFFVCIIILRNTRWWGVVLALIFTAMYIRMNMAGKGAFWNTITCGGFIINIGGTIGYCLLFRYFTGFVMGRYSMQFHTVTVTAEYLTIMQVMAAALLLSKVASADKIKRPKDFISCIWKEMLLFGVISAYMIFTVSRTGYLAAAVATILLIVMIALGKGKGGLWVVTRSLICCIAAVIIAFPMTFTLQRLVPVMVGHPYFYEVEDAAPSTRGGKDLNDYKYMSVERFYSLFRQKILGVNAIGYNYVEDPYNYDENGNYIYDDDGNPIDSEETTYESANLIASALDGLFVTERTYINNENVESTVSKESESSTEVNESAQDDESEESIEAEASAGEDDDAKEEDDYSNGRISIWKTYINELNLTGHDEMGAVAENGEVLTHAHNVYIQVAYDHGIIAGLLFGLMIVAGIAFSSVYYFRNKETFGAAVPFAIVTGFAIAGLTEWNFQLCNPMTLALMLCLPAIIFKEKRHK